MIEVWNLDGGCVDEGEVIVIDLDVDSPIEVFLPGPPGPPGSAAGVLVETTNSDAMITVDPITQFVVVWSLVPLNIIVPLASSRIFTTEGKTYTLPLTIKNETGVAITLTASGSDTLEITSEDYQNQSVTLLPRTGGYSAI